VLAPLLLDEALEQAFAFDPRLRDDPRLPIGHHALDRRAEDILVVDGVALALEEARLVQADEDERLRARRRAALVGDDDQDLHLDPVRPAEDQALARGLPDEGAAEHGGGLDEPLHERER
jgi:hypothetical protein